MYGLDTRYDTGTANPPPIAGQWAPDLALATPAGASTVAELLRPARGVLLDLTGNGSPAKDWSGWADRVDIITAHCAAPPAPALLIRPDGYTAWAGSTTDQGNQGLRQALTTWFGNPADHLKARQAQTHGRST